MDGFDKWLMGGQVGEEPDPFDTWFNTPAAKETSKQKPAPLSMGGYATELLRQGVDAATFGYGDKMAAGINRLVGAPGGDVKAEQEHTAAFARDNPWAAGGAQLAGGLATGVPAAIPVMAAKSLPLLARLGIVGGTTGGLTVGGHAPPDQPWGEFGQDLAIGTGAGALLAPALGVTGNALLKGGAANLAKAGVVGAGAGGALGAAVSDFDPITTAGYALGGAALPFAGNQLLGAAKNVGGKIMSNFGTGASKFATRKIEEALARGEMTVADAEDALRRLGPDAAMIDLANPNIRMLGETVANAPGKPAALASKFLDERAARETGEVRKATQQASGQGSNFFQTIEDLELAASKNAAPFYKEAYAANQFVESKAVDRMLETPAGKAALKGAAERMGNRMSRMSANDPELTALKNEVVALGKMEDPGAIGRGLKLETLDLVKREIDSMWRAAQKRANTGAGTQSEANDLNELRASFVKALDDADVTAKAGPNSTKAGGGAYAKGRAAWAGPTHAQDLMEEGLEFLKHPPELLQKKITKLSPGDRDAYLLGVNRALDDMFLNAPRGSSPARKLLHDQGATEQKLRAVFGEKADAYIKELESRIHFHETRTDVKGNSKTARRLAAKEDAGIDTAPLVEAAQGNVLNALTGFAKSAYNKLAGPTEAQIAELGPMLFDPKQRDIVLKMVGSRQNYNALVAKYLGLPVQTGVATQAGVQAGSSGQRP